MAERPNHRKAPNFHRLEPQGLPTFLALERPIRPAADSVGPSTSDSPEACDNPSWGEERNANELLLKLGLRVSPRTIRKYLPKLPAPGGNPRRDQRWASFLKNHADAIVACDFCVVATATFRTLYVFVVMEHASRRMIHINATANPNAAWTLQQLREAIASDHAYRFIIHDRDAIFCSKFDASVACGSSKPHPR